MECVVSEQVDLTREQSTGDRLGQFVLRERKARDLTQTDVAMRSGVALSLVQNLEQGKIRRPTVGTMRKLAAGLGMRYVDLLIGVGEIEPEDVGLDPAVDANLRRIQALWRDLSPSQQESVVVLAEGMFARNRERAD